MTTPNFGGHLDSWCQRVKRVTNIELNCHPDSCPFKDSCQSKKKTNPQTGKFPDDVIGKITETRQISPGYPYNPTQG